MTAQIGDRFLYKEDEYSVVALSSSLPFNPLDYGIKPEPLCTACWNGYWCDYHISKEGIVLKNLYINSKDNYYPEIHNVSPEKKEKKSFQYMGHHLYKDINIAIQYSGRILIGKEFLREYYIHMGYQRAWAYKVLEELVFDNGKLVETVDHSEMAKKLREELGNRRDEIEAEGYSVPLFVEKSFSLEIKDKAWWME